QVATVRDQSAGQNLHSVFIDGGQTPLCREAGNAPLLRRQEEVKLNKKSIPVSQPAERLNDVVSRPDIETSQFSAELGGGLSRIGPAISGGNVARITEPCQAPWRPSHKIGQQLDALLQQGGRPLHQAGDVPARTGNAFDKTGRYGINRN